MLLIQNLKINPAVKGSLLELGAKYEIHNYCTKGANGCIFLGKNKITEAGVAIKYYYWGGKDKYFAEPKFLATIQSEYIIRIQDAGIVDKEWAYFVTDFCHGGDLEDRLNRQSFSQRSAIDIIKHVLSGISVLHSHRMVHCDLKPSNILLKDDGNPVIGDFGSVKKLPNSATSVPVSGHTIMYRPPESFLRGEYGFRGDIYQCGILLYEVLGGYLPITEIECLNAREKKAYSVLLDSCDRSKFVDEILQKQILKGHILRFNSLPPWVPKQILTVIRKACRPDPADRYNDPTEFFNDLYRLQKYALDWKFEDTAAVLEYNSVKYRINNARGRGRLGVEKDCGKGWRNIYSIHASSLSKLIAKISLLATRHN